MRMKPRTSRTPNPSDFKAASCRRTYCNQKQIGGNAYFNSSCGRKALGGHVLCKSPRCDQPSGRLSGGQRLSGKLVRWSSGGTGTAQCLRCQIRQVEYRRFAHSAAKVAVSGVYVHQKAVWHPAKTYAAPGCGQRDLCYGCRVVRLGDSRERKKRPHLVKNQISKSLKELFK